MSYPDPRQILQQHWGRPLDSAPPGGGIRPGVTGGVGGGGFEFFGGEEYQPMQQQQQQQPHQPDEEESPSPSPVPQILPPAPQLPTQPTTTPTSTPHKSLESLLLHFWTTQMNTVENEVLDFRQHGGGGGKKKELAAAAAGGAMAAGGGGAAGAEKKEGGGGGLPLARIKKVMKSDEEVKMISAEAPVLLAKACEIFISELTTRAWLIATTQRRRTLQKSDVAAAIGASDMFDFLIDIVPREEAVSKSEMGVRRRMENGKRKRKERWREGEGEEEEDAVGMEGVERGNGGGSGSGSGAPPGGGGGGENGGEGTVLGF